MRQLLLALDLDGVAQIIKGLRGPDCALVLPGLDGRTGYGVGLAPQVLVVHPGGLLDRLRCQGHHLDLAGRRIGVTPNLELFTRPLDDRTVRAIDFLARNIPIGDSALVGHNLIGVHHEQSFAGALVQVLLDVPNATNRSVWKAISTSAVAPDRSRRELVVPEH